jgi:hypothetical protein
MERPYAGMPAILASRFREFEEYVMSELNELRLNDNRMLLKDHVVRSPILPKTAHELERDVVMQGNCEVEGAVFARNLEVQQGSLHVKGCVYTQVELHVNSDAKGKAVFDKAVGSSNAIVSLAPGCRIHFLADVSAKQVKLSNAYVAANIFADEIVLDNCVVIGGVFATRSLELSDCVVGTFNSPVVRSSKTVYLLFPSAFSVEKMGFLPGSELFSLALADLGALMRRTPEAENTGKIRMNIEQDEVKTVLSADGVQQILRSYSVVGKVLATGLVDYDRLQNQFLISCASMGNQLLRIYDLGTGADGVAVELTPERIAEFFFDILHGKILVSNISGEFDLASIVNGMTPGVSVQALWGSGGEAAEPVEEPSPQFQSVEGAETTEQLALMAAAAQEQESTEPKTEPADEGPATPVNAENLQRIAEAQPSEAAKHVCKHCGTEAEEGSAFCENCGQSLD